MCFIGSLSLSLVILTGGAFAIVMELRPSSPKPQPDYRRINTMERELGLRQTNYSEFGVAPVDVAEEMIRQNERLIRDFDEALLSPEEKELRAIERQMASALAVPSHILPMDTGYPVEIVSPFDEPPPPMYERVCY